MFKQWPLRIDSIDGHEIIVSGSLPDWRGDPHSHLRPVLHIGDIAWKSEPKVGDFVILYDGAYTHDPR